MRNVSLAITDTILPWECCARERGDSKSDLRYMACTNMLRTRNPIRVIRYWWAFSRTPAMKGHNPIAAANTNPCHAGGWELLPRNIQKDQSTRKSSRYCKRIGCSKLRPSAIALHRAAM
jgi:hypothetical protein